MPRLPEPNESPIDAGVDFTNVSRSPKYSTGAFSLILMIIPHIRQTITIISVTMVGV